MELRERHFRNNPLCVRCKAKGKITPAMHLDHVVPLAKLGADEEDNMQGLCIPCHKEKTAEDFGHKLKVKIGVDGYPVDE